MGRPQHCPRLHPLPRKTPHLSGRPSVARFLCQRTTNVQSKIPLAERGRPVVAPTEFLLRQARQSAEPSHNQNSVKQKQTKEAAVSYHHVGATIGRPQHCPRLPRLPLKTPHLSGRPPVARFFMPKDNKRKSEYPMAECGRPVVARMTIDAPVPLKNSAPLGATTGRPRSHVETTDFSRVRHKSSDFSAFCHHIFKKSLDKSAGI